ncbi:MAG: ABC transporter ATP-binding protein [Bacilli bacterium]|nr:ABC transporter ATP-binding protein [Bacilli bacterium]
MLFGRYINKYYLKYAIFFIIGVAALVMVDIAQLFVPEYLGEVVDILTKSGNALTDELKARILYIIIATLVIAGVMMLGRMLWRFTIFHASFKIEAGLREQMFLKASRLSQRYYHENKVGTVMAWFTNDIEVISDFFGWGTIMLVDAVFMSIFVIVKMVMLDWALSIIAFIPIILIVVWGIFVEKIMSVKWDLRQKSFDDLYDFTQETFTGIGVIKAFVKETQQIHAFAKLAKKDKDINVSFARLSVAFDVCIEIIISIIVAVIMGFGGWFVYGFITGTPVVIFNHEVKMELGHLITFMGYFDILIWPMIALGQIISMHSRAQTSLKRITTFLDEKEEICNREGSLVLSDVKGKITFNNFSFTYPGSNNPSLKNISLEIKEGETIGIVGKIGCGKTTLVNSLLRLYNIEDNAIKIDDTNLMDCNIQSVRDVIAYVPQDNFLFSDKIKNNISFSDSEMDMDKIVESANFADVHNDIYGFRDGYETVSGERGVTLSGGQKQRISIARAYAKNAPIMILDDSVSAVDVKTEETILHNIREARKGKTTLVVASRVSTVSHLDKIIVLNDGELEAYGSHKELLETSPTYQKMVYLQKLEEEMEGGNA